MHHLLPDLARLLEVLVQVDQLLNFLYLLFETGLHYIGIFHELIGFEKLVHLPYSNNLFMVANFFVEVQSLLLRLVQELLTDVVAALHLLFKHFLKKCTSLLTHRSI